MVRATQYKPPELKSARELVLMRESGKLVARALQICRDMARPGVKTIEIDQAVEKFYTSHDATPLFKGYPGKVPFPAVTCLSVNEEVVHGIPKARVLREGDLLKVDTACRLNGWCADRAIAIPIGTIRPEWARLVRVAGEALQIAIDELPRRKWWSEVASRMQKHVETSGFRMVEAYVGHGIGRNMHEDPQVPNFGRAGTGPELRPGMTLAIEPMVNQGGHDVYIKPDGWTVMTADGRLSAYYEHTVAITADGPRVLTLGASEASRLKATG